MHLLTIVTSFTFRGIIWAFLGRDIVPVKQFPGQYTAMVNQQGHNRLRQAGMVRGGQTSREKSEFDTILRMDLDYHIGNPIGPPMQQRYPIRRVEPASLNPVQANPGIDIGVIADSHM